MRAVVAGIALLLSCLILGFVVVKWAPVIIEDGLREAVDQLVTSKANVAATGTLLGFGMLFLCLGVLLSGEAPSVLEEKDAGER